MAFLYKPIGTTAINGAPPSVLSPTALAGFQIPQHNGQTPEMYANGIPHYPGECQVVELGKENVSNITDKSRTLLPWNLKYC